MVAWALDAALGSGLEPTVLVLGREGDSVLAAALRAVPAAGVTVVRNEQWESGIASSLRAALGALYAQPAVDAVVVGLGDQPLVGSEAYVRVAAAYDSGARLAVATYAGARANPVLLARDHWDEALELEGDEGARALMKRYSVVEVPCDGTGDPTDVDTPQDLAALEARWRSPTDSA